LAQASCLISVQDSQCACNMASSRRANLKACLRRTKVCMYHLKGVCQNGAECTYAHSCADIEAMPNLQKTQLCIAHVKGQCGRGDDCKFAHGEDELRSSSLFYKTALCTWHERQMCRNGDNCRFAHGMAELRSSKRDHLRPARIGAEVPLVPPALPVPPVPSMEVDVPIPTLNRSFTNGRHQTEREYPEEEHLVSHPERNDRRYMPFDGDTVQRNRWQNFHQAESWRYDHQPVDVRDHASAPEETPDEWWEERDESSRVTSLQNDLDVLCQNIALLSSRCAQIQQDVLAVYQEQPVDVGADFPTRSADSVSSHWRDGDRGTREFTDERRQGPWKHGFIPSGVPRPEHPRPEPRVHLLR